MKIESINKVLCIGISILSDSLRRQGVEVVDVEWHPPMEIEEDLKKILDKLL